MSPADDTWLTPRQQRQRIIATVLAASVVITLTWIAYAAWWVPWSGQHARLKALLDRRDRVEAVLHSRPALEVALQRADLAANRDPLLLPESTRDQAVAGMMQRFQGMVTSIGSDDKHCRIESQTPGASVDVQRLAVTVHLRCGNSEWMQLVQAMEVARPAMFVDELSIVAPPVASMGTGAPQQGVLDINLMLYGFPRLVAAPGGG